MAVIDGQFDPKATLKDDNTNVEVGGPLGGFDDFDLTLHVVVVDADGVVAEGKGRRNENAPAEKKPAWTCTAGSKDGRKLKPGNAIGYALAVGTGSEGIKSWQWHSKVELLP